MQRQFLNNALQNNRTPQAIIFSGPKGSGKKQTALEFIKTLHGGEIIEPDFVLIKPEGKEIQIDQIRELKKSLNLSPHLAKIKAALIEEAHLMNKLAQNCFLKTLEEPPGNVIFILLTAFPDLLLSTIRSRCSLLKFFPEKPIKLINQREMEDFLQKNLVDRFSLAEKLAKQSTLAEINQFLEKLVIYLRSIFLADFNKGKEIKEKIEKAEAAKFLLATTNVSKRLTLENLFLNL